MRHSFIRLALGIGLLIALALASTSFDGSDMVVVDNAVGRSQQQADRERQSPKGPTEQRRFRNPFQNSSLIRQKDGVGRQDNIVSPSPNGTAQFGKTGRELLGQSTSAKRKMNLINRLSIQGGAASAELLFQVVRRNRTPAERGVWTVALERLCELDNGYARRCIHVLQSDDNDPLRPEILEIIERQAPSSLGQ